MRIRFFHFMLWILLFQFAPGPAVADDQTYLGYSNYQIITDVNFPTARYFRYMKEHGVNFQRMWVTGYSDTATEFDELMPFVQRGNRYDLSRISDAYRMRLRKVMQQATSNNQRVMLTLFDHWSLRGRFEKTPWYFKNNHENLLKNAFPDFYSLENKQLRKIQKNLVREVVNETKRFDPVYEIMNEADGAKCDGLAVWHEEVASWILEEYPQAEIAVNLKDECADVLHASWVDIISFHQNVWERHGICKAIQNYPDKHVIIDTDGAYEVRDNNRLVRGWMSEALRCGASFNHKDDIYEPDQELLNHYRKLTTADTLR